MKIILKIPNDKRNGKQNAKKCAYCDGNFYAIRDTAIYCSDSCKKQFNLEKIRTRNGTLMIQTKG